MKPSLLFHRGTEWKGDVRGSTNVLAARFRAAGYDIAWLGRPFHAGHVLVQEEGKKHCRLASVVFRHDDGVLEIDPFTVCPIQKLSRLGQRAWMASARLGYRFIYPSLQRTFADAGQPPPDLIWTTGGDGGELRRHFPRARVIVQCVDVYEAYAGAAQKALEIRDYQHADAVVAIGHSLAAYLNRERGVPEGKITVVGQGADLELFANRHVEPDDLKPLSRPRLVWVGVVAKADAELMRAALQALPGESGSLVIIGPPASWALELAAQNRRVYCLGPRPASEVPAYLKHCDIGLMLYNRAVDARVYEGQNPLKLYEMAAAGLPIVSTPHAEYRFQPPPVIVAEDPTQVTQAIKKALADKHIFASKALGFAKTNGWDARFKEAEAIVADLLAHK